MDTNQTDCMRTLETAHIAVVGLGYVGLPLALLLATRYRVTGYDSNPRRVEELLRGTDSKACADSGTLRQRLADGLTLTADAARLAACDVYIVAVPTPVDRGMQPDSTPLREASRCVGQMLRKGDVVIYESTVYPGMTEEVCVPVLAEASGLTYNRDFYVGYSPERVNPGDATHTVETIRKVTSGSTPATARLVDRLYGSVLQGGTCPVSSIRMAEATKIIENTQRDVNIAFMNEMARILHALHIDVNETLAAAATKWNFIPMRPGLVGGHCIGVDPYYLIRCAQAHGVNARLIREARETNESMPAYWADRIVRQLSEHDILPHRAHILLVGFTFKPDCADTRNTKVYDLYRQLLRYTPQLEVFDPLAPASVVWREYGIRLADAARLDELHGQLDAVVHCVAHACTARMPVRSLLRPGGLELDITGMARRGDLLQEENNEQV